MTASLILQGTATNSLQSGLPFSITLEAHALLVHQGEIHTTGLQGKKPAATFTKIHAQHAGDFSLTRRDQYTEDFFRGAHGDILDFFSGAKEGAKNHTKKKPAIKKDSMRGLHQRGCGDRKCHSI